MFKGTHSALHVIAFDSLSWLQRQGALQVKGQRLDCCPNAPQFPVLSGRVSLKGPEMRRPRSTGAKETKKPKKNGLQSISHITWYLHLFFSNNRFKLFGFPIACEATHKAWKMECGFNSLISSCQDEPCFTAMVNKNLALPLFSFLSVLNQMQR